MTNTTKKLTKHEQRANILFLATQEIESGMNQINELLSEIEEIRDNLQEHFEGTARYERVEEVASDLGELESSCEDILAEANEITFDW